MCILQISMHVVVVYGDFSFALIYIKKWKCNPYGLTTISLFLKQWLFYYRIESMQVFYICVLFNLMQLFCYYSAVFWW